MLFILNKKIAFYSFATNIHQFEGQNLKYLICSIFYSWLSDQHHDVIYVTLLLRIYIWQSLKVLTLIELEMWQLVLFLHLVCKIHMGTWWKWWCHQSKSLPRSGSGVSFKFISGVNGSWDFQGGGKLLFVYWEASCVKG